MKQAEWEKLSDAQKADQRARHIFDQANEMMADTKNSRSVRMLAEIARNRATAVFDALSEGNTLEAWRILHWAAQDFGLADTHRKHTQLAPDAISGKEQRERNTRAGRRSKRRKWADILALQICTWDDIPDSHDPIEIESADGDLTIYSDGDRVVCVIEDSSGRRESSLARSTFEKTYLRPASEARGQ